MSPKSKNALLVLSLQAQLALIVAAFFAILSVQLNFKTQNLVAVVVIMFCIIAMLALAAWLVITKELTLTKAFKTVVPIISGIIIALLLTIALFWPLMTRHIATLNAELALLTDAAERSSQKELISASTKLMQNLIFLFVALIMAALAALTIYINRERRLNNNEEKSKYFTTQNITRIAIFTSISYILYMMLKFNIPLLPYWLDIQFSDMPAMLAGFMMGPTAGCLVIVFKILLKLPFSSTVFVGEFADLMIGLSLVLPSSLIYKKHKTKKYALIGLAVGVLASTLVAVILNRFVLVPFYVELYFKGNFSTLLNGVPKLSVYENITEDTFYTIYLLFAVIPFNLARGFISSLICFVVYKHLGKLFKTLMPTAPKAQPAKLEATARQE